MRTTSCSTILTLSLAAASASAAGQQPVASPDARWTAWLGCWQQLAETTRDENVVEPERPRGVPTQGVVVCVTPAPDPAGVTLSTIVEKQFVFEETVIADGTNRTIDEPG